MHLSMQSWWGRGGGGRGSRAWGGDIIVFVGPGVGHLKKSCSPGGGEI